MKEHCFSRQVERLVADTNVGLLQGRRDNPQIPFVSQRRPFAPGSYRYPGEHVILALTRTLVAVVIGVTAAATVCGSVLFVGLVVAMAYAGTRANHSQYGLSASVWTKDGARAMRVARALKNGTVWINDHNKLFAEAETGGYRRSGLGRLQGVDALIDFTEVKHIYQNAGVVAAS